MELAKEREKELLHQAYRQANNMEKWLDDRGFEAYKRIGPAGNVELGLRKKKKNR